MQTSLCSLLTSRQVSVPFRGSCSEITDGQRDELEEEKKFPSPFGVRVLKLTYEALETLAFHMFPSPFGVRVLKCTSGAANGDLPDSFRPLSGFVF